MLRIRLDVGDSIPDLEHLVGPLLEICFEYDLENGKEALVYHQGSVLDISDSINIAEIGYITARNKKGQDSIIHWDTNEHIEETPTKSSKKRLKSKWNPKKGTVKGLGNVI